MKNLMREWAFPVALILAWMVTTAYSISIMSVVNRPAAAAHVNPES
ncbi:MAG: hypothetical protein ACXWLM_01940 [Myxococcales bacterium]